MSKRINHLIEKCVEHYLDYQGKCASSEISRFKKMTLDEAIKYASLAISENGKKYPHQRRITNSSLTTALTILTLNQSSFAVARTFDEIFSIVERELTYVKGLGPLYLYDTSLRIGATLRLFPVRVYLHCGALEGAKALGLTLTRQKTIEVSDLPAAFNKLKPYEIEDVLCIYKKCFQAKSLNFLPNNVFCCLK